MVISTHLPPPVMIESTATFTLVTHMLCWSCGIYFSAAASSENDHGSMNLASKTAPVASTTPSRVAANHRIKMADSPLDVRKCLTGIALEPAPIEGLSHNSELDDEISGQILGLDLSPLYSPKPKQGNVVP